MVFLVFYIVRDTAVISSLPLRVRCPRPTNRRHKKTVRGTGWGHGARLLQPGGTGRFDQVGRVHSRREKWFPGNRQENWKFTSPDHGDPSPQHR